MKTEEQLRAALHHDAERLYMTGIGPDAVICRAGRRTRRTRVLTATFVALAVVGAGLGTWAGLPPVAQRVRLQDHAVGSGGQGDPLVLDWEAADDVIAFVQSSTQTANGTTYVLSTAPGVQDDNAAAPPLAVYRTTDGRSWEVVGGGDDGWISDLGARDELLYALGTAPATGGGVRSRIGVSADGGATWEVTDLPTTAQPPTAAVPLLPATTVTTRLAAGDQGLVAVIRTIYSIDTAALDPPETSARRWILGRDGLQLIENGAGCEPGATAEAAASNPLLAEPDAEGFVFCPPVPPIETRSWAELGLGGLDDLQVEEVLVSADGVAWESLPSPFGGSFLTDVIATPDGFVAVSATFPEQEVMRLTESMPQGSYQVWRSPDGRAWAPGTAQPGVLRSVGIVDGTLLGVLDGPPGQIVSSRDQGLSWTATAVADLLEEAPGEVWISRLGTGALGAALVATVGAEGGTQTQYLLTSPDAMQWSVTPVQDIVGDDAAVMVDWISVTENHVAFRVMYGSQDGDPAAPRTFVGVPRG